MAGLKALAKETAIYGMSSIIGRFLNYLLVPIYTNALPVESGGYGIITNMYAITALLMVLLTYGMETGFFRFANKGVDDPMRVYSTTLLSVGATALLFLIVCLSFLHPIAGFLGYGEHPWYMGMMLIVVAMDAFQAIPFAYVRYKKRPVKFAALKLLFICRSGFCYKSGLYFFGDAVYVERIGGLQVCAGQGVVAAYAALFFPDIDSGYCRNLKSGSR